MKKIIIMGVPHHGNLGDNAIAIAEKYILRKYLPEYELYEIPEGFLSVCAKKCKEYISDDDIIFMHGGGNIGDTYFVPENGRREVIKLFPNNKIIIFPQTAYFSDTPKGRKELEISKQIYNNHTHLVILAREEKSYEFMKKHFYNAKVYFTPDIVMCLKKTSNMQRDGAITMFRSDREKTLKKEEEERIKKLLQSKYGKCKSSDMHLGEDIINMNSNKREEALEKKFEEFQSSKLVVTDRLHGMIFAAISETPCVVLGSLDHKISESYKWLKNLGYIAFCKDSQNIEKDIEKVSKVIKPKYDNKFAESTISSIIIRETNNVKS